MSIQNISLSHDKISFVEDIAFKALNELHFIWLSFNRLTSTVNVNWPRKLQPQKVNVTSLKMDLTANKLTSFKPNQLISGLILYSNFLSEFT
jgi:hypothetical protein